MVFPSRTGVVRQSEFEVVLHEERGTMAFSSVSRIFPLAVLSQIFFRPAVSLRLPRFLIFLRNDTGRQANYHEISCGLYLSWGSYFCESYGTRSLPCFILGACFSAACIFCLCAGPCIVLHALSVGWVCFIFSSFRLAYSMFQCHHDSPAVGRLMAIVFSMMGFVDLSTQLPICVIQEKFGSLFCFSEHAWSIVVSSRSGFARVLVTKLADGRQR